MYFKTQAKNQNSGMNENPQNALDGAHAELSQ